MLQKIAPDVKLGVGVTTHDFINLYGCTIGDHCMIGTFVEIQRNAFVGKHCKISSHSFICEGVILEDEVFIGHGVMFINDRYPKATTDRGNLQTRDDWQVIQTRVKCRASIGSNATILAGISIGQGALVGGGSVVTRDVPDYAIVVGIPAHIIGDVRDKGR
jgi:acetyltransferase-like isoleucine patch superfamily enzyme